MNKPMTCRLMLLIISAPTAALQAQGVAGTEHPAKFNTPHPYNGATLPGVTELRWSHTLEHPGATYLAVHFERFHLSQGDVLRVKDTSGATAYELTGKGKMNAGRFWAKHVPGERITLELHVRSADGGPGFVIDRYAAGDIEPSSPKNVYPPDDRENAICYIDSHPIMYERSRAVARLLSGGSGFCTGSIVSPYGHVLTNEHCINTVKEALNSDFDFMAETPTCETANCSNCFPGTIYSGATLVAMEPFFDFALVLLNEGNPARQFGHLEFDNRPAVLGEQIYLPQHSAGRAKELAIFNTWPPGTDDVCRIETITHAPCQGGTHKELGYYADSRGGSSGSPVLAASSHKIIGLHHCASDINLGVEVSLFYDLIKNHILGLTLPGRISFGSVAVAGDTGSSPDNAIDRDIDTVWTSSNTAGPHWLRIDLGHRALVHGFKVWHASAAGMGASNNARAFEIQSADNPAGPWTTEFTGSNPAQQEVNVFSYPAAKQLRHLRVWITDPGNSTTARIAEFEVIAEENIALDTPLGPNVARNAITATVSSQFNPAYGADKAIDGVISEASKWTSAEGVRPPHTLTLDLGQTRSIAGFILRQPSAAGEAGQLNATEFAFQSARSMTGPWYTETYVLTDGVAPFEARSFIAPKDLRYVRLEMTNPSIASFDHYARVPEFEVIEFTGLAAAFTAAPTTGLSPLQVQFTDQSIGDVNTWQWTFGDSSESTQKNPMHTYTTPGTYTVTLKVTGPEGNDTMTRTNYIQVNPIKADFDTDGDVDQTDFGHLQECYTGPGAPISDPNCESTDLDNDNDVDQNDFALIQQCISGANTPTEPICANR